MQAETILLMLGIFSYLLHRVSPSDVNYIVDVSNSCFDWNFFFFFLLQVWVIEMVAQISQVMENACEYVRGNTCVFTENSADPARSNQKCTRTFCISTYFLDHFDSSLMGSLLLSSQEIPFPVLKAH